MRTVGDVHVIGGTYLDQEILVHGPIRPDVSLTTGNRSEAIGGPGFSFAMRLADHGLSVRLTTRLGSCAHSDEARRLLVSRGIEFAAGPDKGALDVATVLIDPDGRKLALNAYELARTVQCTPETLAFGVPLVLASPTPVRSLLDSLRELERRGVPASPVLLAPHSRQIEEIGALPRSNKRLLGQAITVACVNEADFSPAFERVFDKSTVVIVTRGGKGGSVRAGGVWQRYGAVPLTTPVVNSNGAGEAYFAGFTAAFLCRKPLREAVEHGSRAAARFLQDVHAVPAR